MNIFTKLSLTGMLATGTLLSVQAQIGPQINEDFVATKTHDNWVVAGAADATLTQDPTTGVITIMPGATLNYRGDFRYSNHVAIDPVNYPIIAVKLDKPSTGNVILDTDKGAYRKAGSGSNNNQYALVNGTNNVYYYDITSESGAQLDVKVINSTNFPTYPIDLSLFQFKIADLTVRESYNFYWLKSFASLDELKLSVNVAVSSQKALGWNKRVDLSWKNEVSTITSCNIYRSTSESGPFSQIATGVTATSYQDNDASLTNGTTYYYQIRPLVGATEYPGITLSAKPKVSSDWSHGDMGATASIGLPGNAGFSTDGTFTIYAAGKDVWSNDEGFHYVYQELPADGYIIAKVTGLENTHASAKAGVMIREGLGNTSREILATLNPAFKAELGYTKTGGSIKYDLPVTDGASGNYRWVKLNRSGAIITASYSVDGSTWVEGPSVTFDAESPMKNASVPIYIGLFAVSHDVSKLTTATFSDISVVGGTLPVTLSSYTAKLNSNGQANLNWAVSSESNNNYFLIERKSDDGDFTEIARISSKGSGAAVYAYTDANATAGVNYYRLSQVDLNGKKTELGIRSVNVSLTGQVLSVFPNPITNNQFSFTYKQAGNTVSIKIVDLAGKTVFSQTVKGNDGLFNVSTPVGIKAGIYILEVDQAIKQKVVFK